MVKIVYVSADGTAHEIDVPSGQSLMEGARSAGISGITADCGGACACSTCHVYVDDDWVHRLPDPAQHEVDMLEFAWAPNPDRSRLTCQIKVAEMLEGLVLHVPERQA